MSQVKWASSALFDGHVFLLETDLDNANSAATGFPAEVGSRYAVVCVTTPNEITDTGGTWTITNSATEGGQYTTATQSESAVTTPGTTSVDTQITVLGFVPDPAKPFYKPQFTKADTDADVTVSAFVLSYRNV